LGHIKSNFDNIRELIYGQPIATSKQESTLLPKVLALPIFCSDAISSVAYGGQQILLALCLAGLWIPQNQQVYAQSTMTVTWLIVVVLVMVAISYWQTVFAYPTGGGSYIVTKENLGTNLGLIAASALLIDYVLCVSVSIASGMQNLKDVPLLASLHVGDNLVAYCLAGIVFMTLINLRGLKEPGMLFALPVYTFVAMCYAMIIIGLFGDVVGWKFHLEYANQMVPEQNGFVPTTMAAVALAVLLRAFATGCSALTGVEAVSNGVPAFREPKSKNAAITLIWMSAILGTIFLGVSLLAVKFHIVYWELNGATAPAVIDQISGTVFGKTGMWSWAYMLTQFSTALILLVAAQTSFADFPRVTSILARDGFMPRQLANLGDRLAFDNGVWILGLLSSVFIVLKKGSVDLLIPFFTVGVFLAFTLSQCGMVKHWFVCKEKSWKRKAIINGLGAIATFVVLLDIITEKFLDGAWFVVLLIGMLMLIFHKISAHYNSVRSQLALLPNDLPIAISTKVVVLVQGWHIGTYKALSYAKSISQDCEALYVEIEPRWTAELQAEWKKYAGDMPLVIVTSPFRSLVRPIMDHLDDLHKQDPNRIITVVVGEFVSTKWWHKFLHGNTGLILKFAFLSRRDVVVTNVRYWLSESTV
jgi:amino acid transporter